MEENSETSLESLLSVGVIVVLHSSAYQKNAPRFRSVIRGWQKSGHVIVDRPRSSNGAFAALQEGKECILRFISGGRACAFSSQVIDWDTRSYRPYLRVKWPEQVDCIGFRKHERVNLRCGCVVATAEGERREGQLLDLSQGGCQFEGLFVLPEGSPVSLSFSLPDGLRLEKIEGLIKSANTSSDTYRYGCSFQGGQDLHESEIAFYVSTVLGRQGEAPSKKSVAAQLLLVDPEEERRVALKKNLEQFKVEVVPASNAVDALYKLRLARPTGVAFYYDFQGLSAIELCRAIHSAPDLAELPVYLYGGPSSLAERAKEQGVAHYICASDNLEQRMASEIAKALIYTGKK